LIFVYDMPGLDPGIHEAAQRSLNVSMDRRVKPGDDVEKIKPGHEVEKSKSADDN
jgi:hypothetical protein